MNVMAIMAHPDDAELWCGGTLAMHSAQGDRTCICVLTYAEKSMRGREAREGADRLGCEVALLGLKDTAVRDTDEAVERVQHALDSFVPEVIITHLHHDCHPDHMATFQVVLRAVLGSSLRSAIHNINSVPRIFCCETYNSIGLQGPFLANRFIDVTGFWEAKTLAIRAHESQFLTHYLEMVESQCCEHGRTVGVDRAEAFSFMPMFGRRDEGPPLGGPNACNCTTSSETGVRMEIF